jgi:hypothetical protein
MTNYTYSDELVSDLHKDAYGFRPREGFWDNWNAASPEMKEEIWCGLLVTMGDRMDEERAAQSKAYAEFRATLKNVMQTQGVNWKTALRWLQEADGEYDIEHYLWKQGLAFAKIDEILRKYGEAK